MFLYIKKTHISNRPIDLWLHFSDLLVILVQLRPQQVYLFGAQLSLIQTKCKQTRIPAEWWSVMNRRLRVRLWGHAREDPRTSE